MNCSKKLANGLTGILSVFILIQIFGCAIWEANPIRQRRLIKLQSFVDKKYTKKEVLIELGAPLQRIDVEGMEVWKYHFSRGYTHVKETRFTNAQSYEKREVINLFFDDSGQVINFRYVQNLPQVLTDEADAIAMLSLTLATFGLIYWLIMTLYS